MANKKMYIIENGVKRYITEEELQKYEAVVVSSIDYATEVERLIRDKYTVSAELAILRQRDTKPEEFAEYNAYCEDCKAKVKQLISEANNEE